MAIRSFSDSAAEDFFVHGKVTKKAEWHLMKKVVRRKLDVLHFAVTLGDLKSPPGNNLEALQGDLKGCHSIRVNDQWRIIFKWTALGAEQVRVMDYH